jgi:outer membrane protein OmpA-like peptidoglycan-associated protein
MYNRSMSLKNIGWRQKTIAIFLVLLFAAAPPMPGQIRQGAAFLQFTPGAREQGIASSLTGVIDDAHAVYANPGAAGFLREWQWSATYAQWIADVYSASLIYGQRMRTPWSQQTRLALGLAYQGMADFNSTAQPEASASANDLVAALSIGQPLSRRMALGANVKYLRSKLAQYEASSWIFDAGFLFRSARFRFLNTGKNFLDNGIFSAGVAVTQLGQPLTFIASETPLPRTFRAGAAFNTGTHNGLQLHFTVDYKKARDQQGFFSFGSEISWSQIFALRGGYDFNDCLLSHFSFGLTLRLDDRNTPTNALPGRNQALRFDVAAVEDNFLFARTYRGSVTHHAIDPEGFEFISPAAGATINSDSVLFAWQTTKDPDLYDNVNYWLLADPDSLKMAETVATIARGEKDMFSVLEHSSFRISQKTEGATHQLTALAGGDYYWAVMAYDRDRHVRFAESRNRRILHFHIAAPEVEITNLTFDYHPWITEDDLQGKLQVAVRNNGDGAAKNLSFTLYDSVVAPTDGVATNRQMAERVIPQLHAGAVDTLKLEWRTAHAGLHQMTARLDEENRGRESNKKNNQYQAAFYTIPKGRFATSDTAVVLRQSRLAYDVPFIAEVCFDPNSSEVKPDYLRKSILEPPLATLAQRLRGNRDLKISLQGFADPNSGEAEVSLANARAAAVRDSLLQIGVYSEQIEMLPGEVIKPRHPPRDSVDRRWVYQERRYVSITADRKNEDILFQLVSFNLNEPLAAPIVFTAAIAGATPITTAAVQLESGPLQEQIRIARVPAEANLQQDITWQAEEKARAAWVGRSAAYELRISDSLGRQFRTKPRQIYLAAQSLLREQRVAWPIKFRGTEPLYDFYWTKLMAHVNRMLEDKNMRMRFAGHACAIGPEPVNKHLSEERAKTFREGFLRHIQANYPQAIEHLNGDRKMIGDNETPLGRKLNRRLEIEFYYPKEKSPSFSEASRQSGE